MVATTNPTPAQTSPQPIPPALLAFMAEAPWTQGRNPAEIAAALQTIALDDFKKYSPAQQVRITELNAGRFLDPSWQGKAPTLYEVPSITGKVIGATQNSQGQYVLPLLPFANPGFGPVGTAPAATNPAPRPAATAAPAPAPNPAARPAPIPETIPTLNPAQRAAQTNVTAFRSNPILGPIFQTKPLQVEPATTTAAPAAASLDTKPFIDPKDLHKDAFLLHQASNATMDPKRFTAIRDYVKSLQGSVDRFSQIPAGVGGVSSGTPATGVGSMGLGNNSLKF